MPEKHAESPDEYLPPAAAAVLVGVTAYTLKRWEARGRITSVRTPTGHRRYRRGDVEALLTDGVQASA
jgi:DNA-binding transcriptional MerR regulator